MDQIIGKAYQELAKFNWTKEELAAYEEADLQQMAATNMLHTAHIKGRQDRNIEIAKNMLEEGFEVNLIQKVTGLIKEELEKLS